jgi:hypothetical protein
VAPTNKHDPRTAVDAAPSDKAGSSEARPAKEALNGTVSASTQKTLPIFGLISQSERPTLQPFIGAKGIDMDKRKPNPAGKARAAAINAEIDKLTAGKDTPDEDERPGKPGEKAPRAPRDFIHQWMAEHDKKPEKE